LSSRAGNADSYRSLQIAATLQPSCEKAWRWKCDANKDPTEIATDYPSLRAGLAILRKDTRARPSRHSSGMERRGHPIQCMGRPMPLVDPTSHHDRSASNVSEPSPRPIGSNGRGSGSSHHPNYRAPGASPNYCHPTLAQSGAPDPHPLVSLATPPDQCAPRSAGSKRAFQPRSI